jgi:sterol desaturase/sphingolipid hydroxylase (fatty acid hydroxylase superfamily)
MGFLQGLYQEVLVFFNFQPVIDLLRSGDYSSLRTLGGIENVLNPLIPVLLVIEIVRAIVMRRFTGPQYKIPFFIYIFNRFLGRYLSIAALAFCVGLFSPYAIFTTSFTWYWLIYGYIVWELGHFVYHYLGHKVRIFWCLHSTHHAPEHMNLSVTFAHFILEAPYADVIRTSVCILLGVNQPLLFFIMFVDGTWGAFIHVGEHLLPDGRLGFLNRFILTPSHHRVHHAKNPLYMDTNFCNLLNIWDRVFGTYRPQRDDIPIVYGITRPMKPGSFFDVYFGEFVALGRDIVKAPGLLNKLLYVVKPPGWSHAGDHKTSRVVRREWEEQEAARREALAAASSFSNS